MLSLLDDRFWPITTHFLFVETRPELEARVWAEESRRPSRCDEVEGSLEQLLALLPPLTSPLALRRLFMRAGEGWTAEFSNSLSGGNVFLLAWSASLKGQCRAAALVVVEDTWRAGGREGRPGATGLSLFDRGTRVRGISATRDLDRWTFETAGEPLPFEDVARYERRVIRDRFPPELAALYLEAWAGIRVFDPDVYAPDRRGILLRWDEPEPTTTETLEQAQARR
jgi:hypothetical protein